jgi:hypothetical protein
LPDAAQTGADAINDNLARIKAPDLTIKVGLDTSNIPNDFGINQDTPIVPAGATGGFVTANGIQHFMAGGRVLPFVPRGTDTVPAMLAPGEIILNAAQQKGLSGALGGVSVGAVNVVIAPPNGADGKQMVDLFVQELRTNAVLYEGIASVVNKRIAAA